MLTSHSCYYHPNNALFENYYLQQAGNGLPAFAGVRYQRGHGLGNIFRGLSRMAKPLLVKGAKTLGKQLLNTGSRVIADVATGKNFKQSLKRRALEGVEEIITSPSIKKKSRGKVKIRTPLSIPRGIRDKRKRFSGQNVSQRRAKKLKTSPPKDIFS